MKHLKKTLLILLILCLIIVGGIFFIRNRNLAKYSLNNPNNNPIENNNINENINDNNDSSKSNNTNSVTTNKNNISNNNELKNEEKNGKNATGNVNNIQSGSQKEILIEYENKKNNFKIGIPNERAFQENSNGFNLKIKTPKNDVISENLGVTIQELQTEETIESFTKKTIEGLKNLYKNYKEIEKENVEVNGIKGISITYEFSDNGHNIKAKQTTLLKDNKSYIFQYTAEKDTFDIYIEKINKIINSFTILN